MSPDKVEVRSIHLDLKETTMTTATMALTELAEKGVDIDVLRLGLDEIESAVSLSEFVAERRLRKS